MPLLRDQSGRSFRWEGPARRIVSTVPSQTELLADLGLEAETLGITAYCVHPPHWRKAKKVIGGTKDLQINTIRKLQPDLIIGNKEENVRNQIEALAEDIPVWLSDITSVEGALEMISAAGELTGKSKRAAQLVRKISAARSRLQAQKWPPLRCAYFIWKEPYMLAGPHTFISAMLAEAGLQNAIPAGENRYPGYSLAELRDLQLDLILLSSEPYAFNAGDTLPLREIARCVKVVDGELFSWYGSRMAPAFRYFQNMRKELAWMH